jgi:hypothetical protein
MDEAKWREAFINGYPNADAARDSKATAGFAVMPAKDLEDTSQLDGSAG